MLVEKVLPGEGIVASLGDPAVQYSTVVQYAVQYSTCTAPLPASPGVRATPGRRGPAPGSSHTPATQVYRLILKAARRHSNFTSNYY